MPSTKPSVLIIGSGFGGLAAAIELTKHGYDDVTILERSDELGGVWRENTYPGAACDVPSPLYSFSFEPNPTWSKRYSPQPEILDYLKRTAAKYGVDKLIRFNTEVHEAEYDEGRRRWEVLTSTGDVLEADVLVPAVGQLSRPTWPDIPGREAFEGEAFHSAQWDHDVDLTGKRVAVIGTGASAIQFVPAIQPRVGAMTLFQRTPTWIAPQPQRAYSKAHHWLFTRFPSAQQLERRVIWFGLDRLQGTVAGRSGVIPSAVTAVCKLRLRAKIKDPLLRRKLLPNYPLACKRVLYSNAYLDTVVRPNVDVVTESIAEITPTGLRTTDGVEHPADVIVYGTGFAATEFLMPMTIRGLGGQDLQEAWAEGARAYLGLAVPGFPNMFVMYGPNTNLSWTSIIAMLEPQARYIRQAVQLLDRPGSTPLDLRPRVADRFDAELQSRLRDSVWTHCDSYYRTANGRVVTNWPGTVTEYAARTDRLDPADYQMLDTP